VGPRVGLNSVAKRKNPLPCPVGNRTPVVQPIMQYGQSSCLSCERSQAARMLESRVRILTGVHMLVLSCIVMTALQMAIYSSSKDFYCTHRTINYLRSNYEAV